MDVYIYSDTSGLWWWHLSKKGKVVYKSDHGYARKDGAERAYLRLKKEVIDARVIFITFDKTGGKSNG